MATFAFAAARAAIVTAIETQLPAVTINDFPVPADGDLTRNTTDGVLELVQLEWFRAVRSEGSYGTTDGRRRDDYTLPGAVEVQYLQPAGLALDTGLKVAEDRAGVLLDAISTAIETDPTLGGIVMHSMIENVEERAGADTDRVMIGFDFDIRIQSFQT